MASVKINDFSGGWQPNVDHINGPKNCLLQMDNVELDETGALTLTGGFATIGDPYSHPATDIFSNILDTIRHDYVADNTGEVFDNGNSLFSGGSIERTAFGVAYEYTLICSGNKAKKINSTSDVLNLGIGAPATAPTLATTQFQTQAIGNAFITVDTDGTSSNVGGALHLVFSGGFKATCQTDNTFTTEDFNSMTDALTGLLSSTGAEWDLATLTITAAALNNIKNITSFKLYLLVDQGTATGKPVANYYQLIELNNTDMINFYSNPTGTTEKFSIFIHRYDFIRIGVSGETWSTIRGFRVEAVASAATTINVTINTIQFIGGVSAPQIISSDPTRPDAGSAPVNYIQVNVRVDGSYVGQSEASPSVSFIQNNGAFVGVITPVTPSDSQVNQIWIYRQDPLLNFYYRVMVLTSAQWGTAQVDNTSDETALAEDIVFDPTTIGSIASILPILAICGPFEGRWFYFTDTFVYPTAINSPDAVELQLGIRTCGLDSEIFLWAKVISNNGILVCTSRDMYLLTGTFITLPDTTIDVYYRPLSCPYPGITFDAAVYNGTVYYMAKDGWRAVDGTGASALIVSQFSDTIYKGITRYGYITPVLNVSPGTVRFPIMVARNKIWCSVLGTARVEVYDFQRKYWRPIKYGHDVYAMFEAPDSTVEAFFNSYLQQIDIF